jgi:virginiamycin B lyase
VRRLWLLSLLVLGLALPAGAHAGTTPSFSERPSAADLPGHPEDLVAGPDGALWFTARAADGIGRVTTGGTATPLLSGVTPSGIAVGPDGSLWFADSGPQGQLGRVASDGTMEFLGPSGDTGATSIVAGPDGALWFTEAKADRIGRMSTSGRLTEYDLAKDTDPYGIAVGPDGALWFSGEKSGTIGRIATDGTGLAMYSLPDSNSHPQGIVAGPDGALWFTEFGKDKIGRMTTSGSVTEYALVGDEPSDITLGPDGALWFTETKDPGRIGRVTTAGDVREWLIPTANSHPLGITVGPDGALWFAESSKAKLGRITTGPGAQVSPVTDATDTTATVHGAVTPAAQATTYYFEYGLTTAYGTATTAADAGEGPGSVAVQATLGGLTPDTTYHYRLVAVNDTDTTYGPERTFRTQPSLASDPLAQSPPPVTDQAAGDDVPPAPVLGRSMVVGAAQGAVTVRFKGTRTFVPLSRAVSVPTGSELDTTNGTVRLVSALDTRGHTQTGTFSRGRFSVRQSARSRGMVDLYLTGPKPGRCAPPALASARLAVAAKRTPKARSLWGRDNHGRFRTHGRDSVATVRGTRWLTQDRCDGTLTRVTEGAVVVRELHGKRTKVVRAGQTYLARRR